jgi:hypothetical protein
MHSQEENRTQVGKRKTKHAHCIGLSRTLGLWRIVSKSSYTNALRCGIQNNYEHMRINNTRILWTQKLKLIYLNAYTQSHAGVHVSRTHLQEHVVDMCRVLISRVYPPRQTAH